MNKKVTDRKPRTKKIEPFSGMAEDSIKMTPKEDINNLIHFFTPFKCKNKTQKDLIKSIETNDVTVCIGPSGCGKSLVSIYAALNLLKENNKYKNILLLKSITQLNDEMLPALPGDAMEKMYFQNMSFIDSLIKLIGEKNTGDLINSKYINFGVIGSLRGRDLSDSIVIVDETQNITKDNLKTILTRLSENAKIVLLGDPEQIDIRNKKNSSLRYFIEKIKINPMSGIAAIEFNKDEIVRHRLTSYFTMIKDVLINIFKTSTISKGR